MSTLFWFSFFFAAPPNNCSAHGTPMLEIRERSETSESITTKRIYSSGAWTLKSDSASARGCFSRKELKAIRRAVQQAAWKVTSSPIACFAYDPNFTEYRLNGRLRYTHRMCSGKTADAGTLEAIELVERELDEEMPAPPPVDPLPPVKPPVAACRVEGTPLFEIRKRSDVQEATSTIAIYSSGAWTFQPIDADGRLGALTTGCFDKHTLKDLRSAVNDSPWDVTFSRIVCRAYSPSFIEYYVHGKHEYTARLCGEQRIDDTSAAAIKRIDAELAKVLPAAAPPPPPVKPPVADCRATGTPLFEVRHRSEIDEPTSTIKIFGSGAWTYQPVATNARYAMSQGCFDSRTIDAIRAAVANAPWDTTISDKVCKAYSARFTEYYVNGRYEYKERLCGAEHIDATSAAAIKLIDEALAKVLPAQAVVF
jgi:hypothetical protein